MLCWEDDAIRRFEELKTVIFDSTPEVIWALQVTLGKIGCVLNNKHKMLESE